MSSTGALSMHITKNCQVVRTPRVQQVESLFDLPISERSGERWKVDLPLDDQEWSVGLIVGPSGAGKSTIARALWGEHVRVGFDDWPTDASVIDAMPPNLSIKDITGALTGVGFGSPPNWLRPFAVLSTGEQFRATAARALLESSGLVVLDEFTSVIDRQVAQVASHSIQKAVRRTDKRLIAVTCHYDVLEWLQPDWVYQPHTNSFTWRLLQRHPDLDFRIYRVDRTAWRLFSKYHYLSGELHAAAQCFGGFINGECVAFSSYLHLPHPKTRNVKQGHRLVVRPDYQGLGLGGRFDDWLGQWLYEREYRYHNTVAHPAMIAYYSKSPRWKRLGIGPSGPKPPGAGPFLPRVPALGRLGALTESEQKKRREQVTVNMAASHHGSWTKGMTSGAHADPSLRRTQSQLRRLNTVTFEYVPPVAAEGAMAG
jgi:GNAT superfamily N-acetyltransferase